MLQFQPTPMPSATVPLPAKAEWQPYFLLALLAAAILACVCFAVVMTPSGGAQWIPVLILLAGVAIVLGFFTVIGMGKMRAELGSHLTTESALKQASAFRQALEASTSGGLRARDNNGRITYVSPAFCRMTGFTKEELVGTIFPNVPYWNPAQSESNLEKICRAMNGENQSNGLEVSMRRKNGELFDALVIESPFIDVSGQHIGWLGAVVNITEQKRLRKQSQLQYERLQATSRLVTMGEMASTMAHELNQPLAAISSYTSGCLNQLDANLVDVPTLKEVHQKIARQARRAADIIGRVHSFVRRAEPHFAPCDLNNLVREAIALIEISTHKQKVRIICELQKNLPPVMVDTQMIEQVIVNLLSNAIDSMDNNPPETRTVNVSTYVGDNNVFLSVADHGSGIPPEIMPRLFEPFFTTKGKGMGMGLNICRSIVESHHGRLSFEPNPTGGTIFTLTLLAPPLHIEQEK
ncbi:MAG: PAS domain S-box protein [Azoarcus sp.]|jgi:two-component system sensor histidine kinase DctS|nr:PAS domain S-box protein [Azoarcus sp.]